MGARRVEDLVAWQLADELKRNVYAITAKPPASQDFSYRDQIRDACASVTRNTAEGFGRFRPRAFAQFLVIAAASLHEVKDELRDGQERGYISEQGYVRLRRLTLRALKANLRLQEYLRKCPPEGP